MRVTEQMVISNYLSNISKTRKSLDKLNQQLASNSKVSTASDDPFAAEAIMRYQSQITKNAQYQKNVDNAVSFLETTFDATDEVIGALTDLKVIITGAANTTDADTLNTYGAEAESILQRLVDLGNTKFNNKYIFAGTNTGSQPFVYDGTNVSLSEEGTGGDILVDIGSSTYEKINTDGQEVFSGTEIFEYIEEIRDAFNSGSVPTDEQIDKVDGYINSVNVKFGKIGAVTERFKAVATQLESEEVRLKDYLGNEKDIDLADTIVKLTQVQTNLEAAFKAWSDVLQKSLFNFLQ